MSGTGAVLVRGALAGLAATGAMSAVLMLSERTGVMHGPPPRIILDHLVLRSRRPAADRTVAAAHAGYGLVAGAVFAVATRGRGSNALIGVLYGVGLWATGYEGWVPAGGALPPAHRDDPGRVMTMIGAHVVYGYVLARRLAR